MNLGHCITKGVEKGDSVHLPTSQTSTPLLRAQTNRVRQIAKYPPVRKKNRVRQCFIFAIAFTALRGIAQSPVTTQGGAPGSVAVFDGVTSVSSAGLTYTGSQLSVKNLAGTEAIQISAGAPSAGQWSQIIGQGWGTGGHLTLIGNPVNVSDTGGIIFLGGSERGDGMKRKVWISGNSQFGTPVSPGVQVDEHNNVGVGISSYATPSARLEVNGNIKLTQNSGASITFADGTSQSTAFNGTLCGGDYAESIDVTNSATTYEPGDVLVLDPENLEHFRKADTPYSTFVAGVYSTKPGVIGRHQTSPQSTSEIPMAMIGIVPTKVSAVNGPVHVGDLLVTSGTPGVAMKGTDVSRMLGSVIGKAMANVAEGTSTVNVLVNVQ